jgi:hypothetical protein
LVSSKGVGNFCWLDIDWDGTESMIEHETRQSLPHTLTTSSRPQSAPWRRHFCFRQTPYSVSQWKTEMTGIRDFAIVENGEVPNQFDMKGCGGGGFVVAAGCVRAHGGIVEAYTVTDDVPVIPVPDWLVDWVSSKWKRFLVDNKQQAAIKAAANKASQLVTAELNVAHKVAEFEASESTKTVLSINCHFDEMVPKEYAHWALKSLAGTLASKGVLRDVLERFLLDFAKEQIEGGIEFVATKKGRRSIQNILNGLRWGNLWITRKFLLDENKHPSKSRHDVLTEAAQKLPWWRGALSSEKVYSSLMNAAEQAGFALAPHSSKTRMAVSRALKAAGATARQCGRNHGWVWERETEIDLGTTPHALPQTHNGTYVM